MHGAEKHWMASLLALISNLVEGDSPSSTKHLEKNVGSMMSVSYGEDSKDETRKGMSGPTAAELSCTPRLLAAIIRCVEEKSPMVKALAYF